MILSLLILLSVSHSTYWVYSSHDSCDHYYLLHTSCHSRGQQLPGTGSWELWCLLRGSKPGLTSQASITTWGLCSSRAKQHCLSQNHTSRKGDCAVLQGKLCRLAVLFPALRTAAKVSSSREDPLAQDHGEIAASWWLDPEWPRPPTERQGLAKPGPDASTAADRATDS